MHIFEPTLLDMELNLYPLINDRRTVQAGKLLEIRAPAIYWYPTTAISRLHDIL